MRHPGRLHRLRRREQAVLNATDSAPSSTRRAAFSWPLRGIAGAERTFRRIGSIDIRPEAGGGSSSTPRRHPGALGLRSSCFNERGIAMGQAGLRPSQPNIIVLGLPNQVESVVYSHNNQRSSGGGEIGVISVGSGGGIHCIIFPEVEGWWCS